MSNVAKERKVSIEGDHRLDIKAFGDCVDGIDSDVALIQFHRFCRSAGQESDRGENEIPLRLWALKELHQEIGELIKTIEAWYVVDLERSLQLSEAMNRVLEGLRSRLVERPALAQRIDDVQLAEGGDGGGVVACLEGRVSAADASEALALAETPGLAGLGLLMGAADRRRFVLLRGVDHVTSRVLGLGLRAHVRSFFQGNRFLVEPHALRSVALDAALDPHEISV